ncbi:SAM-dependent methyltransferase [Novosphingobium sp. SG720]|uniref:class I SAM-dependent methyltransferase n=1 Tax=Novosphingobium sp. SG720 TaxID=2586998 RepID=UPI0014461A9E|nr:SAM-dependent methyltransferase [Novosphingobium sp. SG720]NKJ42441.1 NADH dehydrogenase [ubiquinone] 1 alpha subcomplex assembly factor 7 [Novosphingobium sp. SG720]
MPGESRPPETLKQVFARLIRAAGPISVAHFMAESNARYYAARDPLGTAGDFITAPEVSQMFGEMIGLWLADIWIRAGRPTPVAYVEAGPGRGTLAQDALRAAARQGLVPDVHFVETSPTLRAAQCARFPQATWHDDFSTLPQDRPLMVVGNEFLDALPVRQLVRMADGWRERMIGWDAAKDRLLPVAGDRPMDAAVPAERAAAREGTIIETCPAAAAVTGDVALRLAAQGGVALWIDYGHAQPRDGSTLQAVRAHAKVDPFADPGEADLTALVDFAALVPAVASAGARCDGVVTQGEFLRCLGIEARAAGLARHAPGQAAVLARALHRLVHPDEMGNLFKAMAFSAVHWPKGAAF